MDIMFINHASPSLLPSLFSSLSTPLAFSSTSLDPHPPPAIQNYSQTPGYRSLDLIPPLPFPCNALTPPSPHLPANHRSFSMFQGKCVFALEPSFGLMTFPGIWFNLALNSFKGVTGWHCNWLFTCLSFLGLWVLDFLLRILVACTVPDYSEGSMTDFSMSVLYTKVIGGSMERSISLSTLALLSCKTSTYYSPSTWQ